jgi:superfamily II DNA/RNA helicase
VSSAVVRFRTLLTSHLCDTSRRLGRTARAGKSGTGLLLLAPFEYDYVTRRELKDLPLQEVSPEATLPRADSPLVSAL